MILAEQMSGYGPPAPVPIFQWQREFEVLLELYKRSAPKSVLEVGTYYGGTLYHWLANALPGTTVVSLDSYAVGVDNRHLYEEWIPDDVVLHIYEGNSMAESTRGTIEEHAPFDWVWIDAGHFYHEVLSDWQFYGAMAAPGGTVAFHDILPPTQEHPEIEVDRLWQQIRLSHHTLEIVADRNASWGGIGVVLL